MLTHYHKVYYLFFFFSSRRRHTRFDCDWSSTCALPICQLAHRFHLLRLPQLSLGAVVLGHVATNEEIVAVRIGPHPHPHQRSEERRVGKECRTRRSAINEQN